MTERDKEKVMCECGQGPMTRKHTWSHKKNSKHHLAWEAQQRDKRKIGWVVEELGNRRTDDLRKVEIVHSDPEDLHITLPEPAEGVEIEVKNVGEGTVTIEQPETETIDLHPERPSPQEEHGYKSRYFVLDEDGETHFVKPGPRKRRDLMGRLIE